MTHDPARPGAEPATAGHPGPVEDGQLEQGEAADLLSIGLLVFFVALLLVVAALLALPLILG
jgi:hypothetical protein